VGANPKEKKNDWEHPEGKKNFVEGGQKIAACRNPWEDAKRNVGSASIESVQRLRKRERQESEGRALGVEKKRG